MWYVLIVVYMLIVLGCFSLPSGLQATESLPVSMHPFPPPPANTVSGHFYQAWTLAVLANDLVKKINSQ